MRKKKGEGLSREKAINILFDGRVRGQELTERQKGFFVSVASGNKKRDVKN